MTRCHTCRGQRVVAPGQRPGSALRLKCRVFLRRVDVQRNERIVDWKVEDMFLVLVFDIPSRYVWGSFQEYLDKFSPHYDWVTVLIAKGGDYGPNLRGGVEKRAAERGQSVLASRRPVDQSDKCGVAPAIKDLLQPNLQGTELAARRIWVRHQRGAFGIHNRGEGGGVVTGNHDDHFSMPGQGVNGC